MYIGIYVRSIHDIYENKREGIKALRKYNKHYYRMICKSK